MDQASCKHLLLALRWARELAMGMGQRGGCVGRESRGTKAQGQMSPLALSAQPAEFHSASIFLRIYGVQGKAVRETTL